MLRVINVKNGIPMSYPVLPSELENEISDDEICTGVEIEMEWYDEKFHPGQIAQLFKTQDGVKCGTSDGTFAVGIIDDIRDPELGDSTQANERITVWNIVGMIAETDQYNQSVFCKYPQREELFVGSDAKLTPFKLYPEQTPVAKVIRFNKEAGTLRFKWLGYQPRQSFNKHNEK